MNGLNIFKTSTGSFKFGLRKETAQLTVDKVLSSKFVAYCWWLLHHLRLEVILEDS